jgi:hyaluronoglucosaminidase
VVEGFYGKPWAHEDRLWLLERMGRWGMNVYFYAPKDDPLHLARWREPYPDAQLAEFAELVAAGERAGVALGIAVSPGRSIVYSDAADRAAFVEKLASFHALGVRMFSVALDDVPSRLQHDADRRAFRSFAAAQIALVEHVRAAFPGDTWIWLGPTEYLGTESTEYLEELGAGLPAAVEIGWTGRTVCAPSITAAEAAARAATLRRKLMLWDNTPVADGPMRPMLHLNPYTGRDRELAAHVSGLLLNPMEQVRASARARRGVMADPRGYDARPPGGARSRSWEGSPELALFAAAHRFSPSTPDERDRDRASSACVRTMRSRPWPTRRPARRLASPGTSLRERPPTGGSPPSSALPRLARHRDALHGGPRLARSRPARTRRARSASRSWRQVTRETPGASELDRAACLPCSSPPWSMM